MRSSSRLFAAFFAVAVTTPITGVFAESTDVDGAIVDGSQISPAGAESYIPKPGNLNSVPEDGGLVARVPMSDSPLVKQILASRPNEDLVICVAGCYTGANRVVYAQPSDSAMRGTISPQTMAPSDPQKRTAIEKPSRSAAAAAPHAPIIINSTN